MTRSAVVELDPEQLIERVDAAEAAIRGRLRDLQYDGDHHEERQLMTDAQHTLRVLCRRLLTRPIFLEQSKLEFWASTVRITWFHAGFAPSMY